MANATKTVPGLRKGDMVTIAEATGLAHITVRKVLNGERKNSAVLKAARKIVNNREATIKSIQANRN